jgi:hypothetical protein
VPIKFSRINVSATNLSLYAPPPSIHDAWLKAQEKTQKGADIGVVDMEVLNALPDDLRREMMEVYGISDIPQPKSTALEPKDVTMDGDEAHVRDSEDEDENNIDQMIDRCAICRMEVYPFAKIAHQRWHDSNDS